MVRQISNSLIQGWYRTVSLYKLVRIQKGGCYSSTSRISLKAVIRLNLSSDIAKGRIFSRYTTWHIHMNLFFMLPIIFAFLIWFLLAPEVTVHRFHLRCELLRTVILEVVPKEVGPVRNRVQCKYIKYIWLDFKYSCNLYID